MTFTNRIENQMTPYPMTADPKMSLTEAAALMKEKKIRHLPVIRGNRVAGIVSDRDLKQALLLPTSFQLNVGDIMHDEPYCAKVGTPLADVVREMARRKIGSTVVLSHLGKPVGIFTTTDALKVLAEILGDEPTPEFAWLGSIEKHMDLGYL